MKKIRVGIIGCGGMAQSHVSRFRDVLDRIEVTAVVDINKKRAQSVANLLPNQPIVETNFQAIYTHIVLLLVYLSEHPFDEPYQ